MKPIAMTQAGLVERIRRLESYRLIDVMIIAGLTALVAIQIAAHFSPMA